jgi:hypothetical protein
MNIRPQTDIEEALRERERKILSALRGSEDGVQSPEDDEEFGFTLKKKRKQAFMKDAMKQGGLDDIAKMVRISRASEES